MRINIDHITSYTEQYTSFFNDSKNIDLIEKITNKIKDSIMQNCHIWFAGNGGSASISDHIVADLVKGNANYNNNLKIKAHNLFSNTALVSAISNDINYGDVFQFQFLRFIESGDLIVLISSSGNSVNILKLAEIAKENKIYTISISGMGGGELATITDTALTIQSSNYGVIEDVTMSCLHIMAQQLHLNIFQ